MKSTTFRLVIASVLLTVSAPIACATDWSFGESSFTAWGGTFYSSAGIASGGTGARSTGGNPGSYVRIQSSMSAPGAIDPVWLMNFNVRDSSAFVLGDGIQITGIDYSHDSRLFSGPVGAAEMGPVIDQDGIIYFGADLLHVTSAAWVTQSLANLSENDFVAFATNVPGLASTFHPDFSSAGSTLKFGVYQRLFTQAGGSAVSVDYGMDDWQVVVHFVPEPSTTVLAASIFALVASRRWRRS
jgi:hypothetical protein